MRHGYCVLLTLALLVLAACDDSTPAPLPTVGATPVSTTISPGEVNGEAIDPHEQLEEGTLSNPDITVTIPLTSTAAPKSPIPRLLR